MPSAYPVVIERAAGCPVVRPASNNNNNAIQKLKDYNIENKFESKMLSTDVIARYFNAKPGDIFRIKRPSTFSGESFHYRLVVESPISVIFE